MASTETQRHGTQRLSAASIDAAAAILRKGGLVAFPTETVYGLGADATDGVAVARVFAAKGRPSFNPLIVHVADQRALARLVEMDVTAQTLASAFWPGPLTLVLPLRAGHGLSSLVTSGLDTLAVRVPGTELARRLLRAVGRPVAAPSANPSGRLSPTRADHVADGLADAVLDGGPCAVGLESTIVRPDPPTLLREGGVTADAIEKVLGSPLRRDLTPGRVQAPGQMTSHYAPARALRLNVTRRAQDAVLLGFGAVPGDLTLSAKGDLEEAAANLFDYLHRADKMAETLDRPWIDVAPIPEIGLGRAIRDRLSRAAAPRDQA
ncbi:MAG: L-threonylcarbamoyladenylate synthase [Pseudomonadota bacterium]